jgi:hypothetical protein
MSHHSLQNLSSGENCALLGSVTNYHYTLRTAQKSAILIYFATESEITFLYCTLLTLSHVCV